MQNVFDEVNSFDMRCYDELFLSEDILMEHAALGIKEYIVNNFSNDKTILIVSGVGNNGADGIALARLLYKEYDVKLYTPFGVKSPMAKLQLKRVESLGLKLCDSIYPCDIVVDCLFGSGLNKPLDNEANELIKKLNFLEAFKIACDIPSGVDSRGVIKTTAFFADVTLTMGSLKKSLFSDIAKDYVGEIKVCDLGISRTLYEKESTVKLLEEEDLTLPKRAQKNTHKGSFGHLNVFVGSKSGAGVLSSLAGYNFGAGLVSVVTHEKVNLPEHIMSSHNISKNCTAIAVGMGLGQIEKEELHEILSSDIPKIVDADMFYEKELKNYLDKDMVLTPHPKEFCSLLALTSIADIDIATLQKRRFYYVEQFCKKYPNITLLLKGANVIIAKDNIVFINSLGSAVLSKGGSGDVLSGLIGALLAQGYDSLDATITASLSHAIAASNYKGNDYSLTPQKLIEEVAYL